MEFSAPKWLRDAGFVAWLLVGIVAILAGAVAVLALTSTIVMPVITASIIAAVLAPVVASMERRMPRAVASGLMLLAILLIAFAVGAIVLGGITSQSDHISERLQAGADKISTALKDLGVSDATADQAKRSASGSFTDAAGALLNGIGHAFSALASLALFASFTALSLFFLLKDGPSLSDWVERHLPGVPRPTAQVVIGEMLRALRGYFRGVTLVALFNMVVVGLGALLLGVPLPGTIAIVTFLGAYIPYLGAWTSGIFAFLLALGDQGFQGALAMGIVVLLANGALQQMVQPFAFGAALDLHPLAVLIVTIAAGCLFGMVGLVLAAPVTSAIVRISRDLAGEGATEPLPAASP
jgi:predicted PurR-regulated permease PerM